MKRRAKVCIILFVAFFLGIVTSDLIWFLGGPSTILFEKEISFPEGKVVVSGAEITGFLSEFFLNFSHVHIATWDRAHYLPSLATLKDFLWIDDLDAYKHLPEIFDCDDYAWALKGRAIEKGIPLGIAILNEGQGEENHMVNLFITRENGELTVYIVEPQTDQITPAGEFREKIFSIYYL